MASSTNVKIVLRLNESWSLVEINGNLAPILHDANWVCPRHAEPLLLHEFRAFKDNRGFYHLDVNVKCPLCDWFTIFGIRLPRDDALLQRIQASKYHGKVLRAELIELAPVVKAVQGVSDSVIRYVEEKIKGWGYW